MSPQLSYPNSYYHFSKTPALPKARLNDVIETEICVIGGGITGLTCALEALRLGKDVVLLEAGNVGYGASGRNGGFVAPGFAKSMSGIEDYVGYEGARILYDLSKEALCAMETRIERAGPSASIDPVYGQMNLIRYNAPDEMIAYQQKMAERYDTDLILHDRAALRDMLHTDRYYCGLLDPRAFHFHPLNYCLSLGRQIIEDGGALYEQTRVHRMDLEGSEKRVFTEYGTVRAKQVVLATGGYSTKLVKHIRSAMLPIATYVIATEKLGHRLHDIIRAPYAFLDDRRASDYYRIVDGDRLLWGGRITAMTAEPKDLAAKMFKDMVSVYPDLKDAKTDFSWMGLMGYAKHLMPQIGQLENGLYYAVSFGGHGLNTGSLGGTIIAEAISGDRSKMKAFSKYGLAWNGGILGPAAVQMTYWHYQIMDFLREKGLIP